jgi:hypothetical protein
LRAISAISAILGPHELKVSPVYDRSKEGNAFGSSGVFVPAMR